MIRGTTPTHTFTIPFDIPEGSKVRVVYTQNDKIIVERTAKECEIDVNTITVTLTSDETLQFDCRKYRCNGELKTLPVEIQVGIETPAGNKLWSNIINTTVGRCLREDGVI